MKRMLYTVKYYKIKFKPITLNNILLFLVFKCVKIYYFGLK